jgi:hypothetical protein
MEQTCTQNAAYISMVYCCFGVTKQIISMQLSRSHFERICRAQVSLLSDLSSPSEKGPHPT